MDDEAVAVTRPLLAVVLELAADADPSSVSVALASRPAGDLVADDGEGGALSPLPEDAPVLADFTFPGAGGAVNRVFGMDLGHPVGRTQARFVSHPAGDVALDRRDDLAPAVLVAVPPWTTDDVRAYDRRGRRRPLHVVAGRVPEDPFEVEPTE